MREFFKRVRKHIDRLDAEHLREQYGRIADEIESIDMIFDAIDRGIVVLDDNGHATMSNPAARTLLGMDPDDALPALGIPLGRASRREYALTYPESRVLEVQTIPMRAATLVYLRDMTSEKARSDEELRVGTTQAVRELASGVAHEIGNPLNALALNLQLMQRSPGKDSESIEICRQQVERLDGIIKGFLQALRPSKPNLTPGSAADPLVECLKAMECQLGERRIAVSLDVPSSLPPVAIDRAQMQQVYFNLIKNALEAMRDGGRLEVDVTYDDNDVAVRLADNGMGMTSEQIAHLFEPYRTSKEHGNGLGLMVSQRIVRDHGGSIAVESSSGDGTAFTIRLPRLERRIRALKE